jgi:uncharacterized Tic20 family protein
MSQQVPPPQPPLPPSGGPPGGGQPGQPPLSADQERLWGMLAHLLSFVAAYIALGFVAPLVFGPRSAFVRAQAIESLNFNLSWLLYAVVGGILLIVGIGLLILIALGIAYVVLIVIASIRANNGEFFRYPLTIRFMR